MHRKRHAYLVPLAFLAMGLVAVGCGSDTSSFPLEQEEGDPAPPTSPTGLSIGKSTSAGMKILWNANPEADLAGYDIYVYDPDPFRDNSYVKLNADLLEGSAFVMTELKLGETYFFKVRAVNDTGLMSAPTLPLEMTWTGGPYEGSQQEDIDEESGGRQPGTGTPDGGETHPQPDDDGHSDG